MNNLEAIGTNPALNNPINHVGIGMGDVTNADGTNTDDEDNTPAIKPVVRLAGSQVLKRGLIAVAIAAVVNVALGDLAGTVVPIASRLPMFMPITIALFTVVFGFIGVGLYALLNRKAKQPNRLFRAIAVVALLLSFVPNVIAINNPTLITPLLAAGRQGQARQFRRQCQWSSRLSSAKPKRTGNSDGPNGPTGPGWFPGCRPTRRIVWARHWDQWPTRYEWPLHHSACFVDGPARGCVRHHHQCVDAQAACTKVGANIMSLFEIFRTALESLAANKLRTVLTMLGVIIGVTSVVTLLALGAGVSNNITNSIQGNGTNVLSISPDSRIGNARLTMDDVDALADPLNVPYLDKVVPTVNGNLKITFGANSRNTSVQGTTPDYFVVRTTKLDKGTLLPRPTSTRARAWWYWAHRWRRRFSKWRCGRADYFDGQRAIPRDRHDGSQRRLRPRQRRRQRLCTPDCGARKVIRPAQRRPQRRFVH